MCAALFSRLSANLLSRGQERKSGLAMSSILHISPRSCDTSTVDHDYDHTGYVSNGGTPRIRIPASPDAVQRAFYQSMATDPFPWGSGCGDSGATVQMYKWALETESIHVLDAYGVLTGTPFAALLRTALDS